MHPTIWKLGGFEIHSYGVLLAIAFLVAIQLFTVRGRKRGISEEALSTVALLILILAIVGGRGLFVLTHWSDYASDPVGVLRLWEGGLMLYGGYILAIAGAILYIRSRGLPLWRMADAAAPSMAIGIGIGRLGCFLNGCCFGTPSHVPWAVTFPAGSYSAYVYPTTPLHPSQLYLAFAGFALFFLLLRLDRGPRFDGWLFWTGVALDAALRFGIDFTRYYDGTSFLGKAWGLSFNVNQVLSAVLIAVSLVMLRALSRVPRAEGVSAGDAPPGVPAGEPRSGATDPDSSAHAAAAGDATERRPTV